MAIKDIIESKYDQIALSNIIRKEIEELEKKLKKWIDEKINLEIHHDNLINNVTPLINDTKKEIEKRGFRVEEYTGRTERIDIQINANETYSQRISPHWQGGDEFTLLYALDSVNVPEQIQILLFKKPYYSHSKIDGSVLQRLVRVPIIPPILNDQNDDIRIDIENNSHNVQR
ncbi:MAG: hypothetical protein ACTSSP_11010, partial [Candidatus Asgardarchaeia archaeon]